MEAIPDGVEPYSRTPEFTESTIPDGLRASHSTKAGVWARIVVLEGRLRYRIDGPPPEEHVLSDAHPGVAAPRARHAVQPDGPVRFFVEFLR